MAEAGVTERGAHLLRTMSHYAFFRFTPDFLAMTVAERRKLAARIESDLGAAAKTVFPYRIFPARPETDIMFWSSLRVESTDMPGQFFDRFADATLRYRRYLTPTEMLWGFTRASDYSSGKSAQEIDPFEGPRKPYLVIYPFVKTTDWYLMSRDSRQGMMNGHIRIGREFPEILQLLLYSTGLQDQEFVVSYETDDLSRFSDLVTALRATEARRFTLRDTPIYTAMHRPLADLVGTTD